jgi:hypothetical protein
MAVETGKIHEKFQPVIRPRFELEIASKKKSLEPRPYIKWFSKPSAAILIATWIVYMLL